MRRLLCLVSGMNAGGAETFLMKLYRKIDRTKYQMDFCVNIPAEGFYDREIRSLGGKIYHIPSKTENVKEFKEQLTSIVRENHYEYVLRTVANAAGLLDLKIAKNAGARVCIARSSNSSDGKSLRLKIANRLGRWAYSRYVDVKIAPSDVAAVYTFGKKAYQNNRVTILRNAVDLNVFSFTQGGRSAVRSEFDIADEDILLGHIGRFSTQKNHEFLLEVFRKTYQKDPRVRLLLVGDGELKDRLRKKADDLGLGEAIAFSDVRSDTPQLLSAMDVLLLPSLYEGMPNVLIEAQAVGIPCIASDRITKEADISGKVTFLPLGDSEDLWVDQILKTTAAASGELTKHGSELKGTEYDIDKTVERFIETVFIG